MKKQKHTSEMSLEERKRRRAEIGKFASAKIAKSEQLNFRIEERVIRELQELAYQHGLPVSTMIHDWVLERLAQEKSGKTQITGKALQILGDLHGELQHLFGRSLYKTTGAMKVAEDSSTFMPKHKRSTSKK